METLKQREERKRDLAYSPAERWRQMLSMIGWVEANLPPRLRRNRPRTRQESKSGDPDTKLSCKVFTAAL